MGLVIKQSGISSVFTYIGTIIGFVNTVVLFPAFLSADQIGLLRVLPSAAFMLMPLAQLGLGRTLVKFAPEIRKTAHGLAGFVSLLLLGIGLGFVMTTVIILLFQNQLASLFAENSPLFNDYLYVMICLILVLAVYTFFEAYGRIFFKIIVLNIIREILVRVLLSASVSLYFLHVFTFHQVVLSLIAVYGMALICMVGYLMYNKELAISTRHFGIDQATFRRVSTYAGYSILGTGGGYIVLNIDQVMITSLVGLDANGIYTTAFFFAVMIELSRRAISQITSPLVSEFFEDKKTEEIKKIHQQVSINQMVIGILFFIGVTINLPNIYQLMPNGATYEAGTTIVYIIGLSKLVDMSFSNNGEIITLSKHYRFNVVSIAILALLMIALNYVLIPIYGINGAAYATLIAVMLYNLLKLAFIKNKLGFTPFTSKSLLLVFIGGGVFLIGYFINRMENPLVDMLVRSALVTVLYGLLVYFLQISKEINGMVFSLRKKLGWIK